MTPDFTLTLPPGATIGTLLPHTEAATQWLAENVNAPPWAWLGTALCIEPRFIPDILDGIAMEGLTVQ